MPIPPGDARDADEYSSPTMHRMTIPPATGHVMRIVGRLAVTAAACVLGFSACDRRDEWLPAVGPRAEPICEEAMGRAPDLSWHAPDHDRLSRNRRPVSVTLGELRFHSGELVRVEGFLHAEFEWVALYPSRAALDDGWRGPWIALQSLWPNEAEWWWRTKGPSISDRCVRVEGWYNGGVAGHLGEFDGMIEVLRLAVWSEPHRPFGGSPPVPPPPRLPSR